MISDFQRGFAQNVGMQNLINYEWVQKEPCSAPKSQLQFNLSVPPSVFNRPTRVGRPAPIVLEKLLPRAEPAEDVDSSVSSLRLSVLSEERLQAAVRLAKRDLLWRRQGGERPRSPSPETTTSPPVHQVPNEKPLPSNKVPARRSPSKPINPRTQAPVRSPRTTPKPPPAPPTIITPRHRVSSVAQLGAEISKLHVELSTYVSQVEGLANEGRALDAELEPEEKRRMEIRWQEQEIRSSRIIYMLQQQVKDIQKETDKLSCENVKPAQKGKVVDRLAAVHRGAVRAMQMSVKQLSDPLVTRVPAHCRELSLLIRQLSLCSANVEEGPGTAVDILEKLEILDTALRKHEALAKQNTHNSDPVKKKKTPSLPFPHQAKQRAGAGPRRSASRTSQVSMKKRSEILKEGVEILVQRYKLREEQDKQHKTAAVSHQAQSKGRVINTTFQKPTVASQLRENQLVPKEATVPWIPTSPRSPRSPRPPMEQDSRPEPRCLFSPRKGPDKPKPPSRLCVSPKPPLFDKTQAENEALREAWLERVTEDRLRDLHRLSREETDRLDKIRTTVGSPTQWAERAERAAREKIQPLLDQAQHVAETGSEALRQVLQPVGDAAVFQWASERQREAGADAANTLENMLLRMEQIEKDEEAVRRKYAMDPLFWEKEENSQPSVPIFRPASPPPIILTKPVVSVPGQADIRLQIVETRASPNSTLQEDLPHGSRPSPAERNTQGLHVTVPLCMQRSIRRYRDHYDAFLHHKTVEGFNPRTIVDSLADELVTEALSDVMTEFQDICEEYTEAVFTSEFLQHVQSPTVAS